MFCNLGNQIGHPLHDLQPHTMENIGIFAISRQAQESGTNHEKVGTVAVAILNVITLF